MLFRRSTLGLTVGFLAVFSQQLFSTGTRQAFDLAVQDLQKAPDNVMLRRKIFELAQGLKSKPPVPDEVSILKGKALYIAKKAVSPEDFRPAVDAYRQATFLAPWVPDLYYNLGLMEEQAGMPGEAIADFKLYLLANPDANDKNKVLARLGKLEVERDEGKVEGHTDTDFAAAGAPDWAREWRHFKWEEAKAMWDNKSALFIDARAKAEYDTGHIPGAIPLPLGEFDKFYSRYEKRIMAATTLVTYCHGVGCQLSNKVAQKLYEKKFRNVGSFFGGWPQWQQHHMPVETGMEPGKN